MSKIALNGNANGSGTLTIASPNTNSDRTLTLPDSTGTLATAESTLTQFSASGSAPVFAARAWVNFNGTGTVAIRASGNVSSITDVGTGIFAVNFTTAMSDANFAVSGQGAVISGATAAGWIFGAPIRSTSAVRIQIINTADGGGRDPDYVDVAIFR